MADLIQYTCFGIEAFGKCTYNPDDPTNYFTLGNAISALGFTLAIQQLLKPLYRFRLKAYGISFGHLSIGTFIGFLFALFAALLPSLPVTKNYFFTYPLFWEILASIIIACVYGVAAYLILKPTRIRSFNLVTYITAAASFLSEASDEERVRFAADLSHNVKDLFKYASYWDVAEGKFVAIEFSRLRSAGQPESIRGRPPACPFYIFANRKKLNQSTYARGFLRILADKKFCSVMVTDCPWHTASLLRHISSENLYTKIAEGFIQEIALQAICNEDSMMSREVGYEGFAHAPVLSESLFSDSTILHNYRPLGKLWLSTPKAITEDFIRKLNLASEMMLETALKDKDYWGAQYMFDVEHAYENVCQKLGWDKKPDERDYRIDLSLNTGIEKLYSMLHEDFPGMDSDRYASLFLNAADLHPQDIAHMIGSIVNNHFLSLANDFDVNGRQWTTAIGIFTKIFPFHDNEPEGMTPLQQHIAIQFIDKVKQNMDGWYPSLSRVLLAVIGSYDSHPKPTNRTAYVILKDAFYKELQKLPALYTAQPETLNNFLPSNVAYDHALNTLTRTYTGGDKSVTNLSSLVIPTIDLYDRSNRTVQVDIERRYSY